MNKVDKKIDIQNISKTYYNKSGAVKALSGVSMSVQQGDIYGVIGYSGSGKSTLIRCVNRLEEIDKGKIFVGGDDISQLNEKEISMKRQKMGMIFQHFNLLKNDTVFQNVALPYQYTGAPKAAVHQKTNELLDLVGLSGKKNNYPSQLSGGQKQRVAIARALANDPEILLCDEATSALDPDTTHSILQLIKRLNTEMGLTILIITHEMSVVKDICNRVAVLSKGKIIENGSTLDVFTDPKHEITLQFAKNPFEQDRLDEVLDSDFVQKSVRLGGIVARLIYKGESANEALISKVSRLFNIDASVIFGNIEVIESQPIGNFYVVLNGQANDLEQAIKYIKKQPQILFSNLTNKRAALDSSLL